MSFTNRNSSLLDQEAIDSDIERLVRESPIPQMFAHDHLSHGSNNSFARPCSNVGRPLSASAIPKIRAYTTASPCAQFAPFRSPQSLNLTYPASTSYASVADIFNRLKSQTQTGGEYPSHDDSQDAEFSSKENISAVANHAGDEELLRMRNRLQHEHGHGDQSNKPFGSYLHNAANQSFHLQRASLHNSLIDKRRYTEDFRSLQMYKNQASNSSVNIGNNSYEESFQDAFNDTERDEGMLTENEHANSLYMWIIKPVPGSRSICVEGKKSLSDDTFWHSGVITRRINEKIVETQTGSVYRLEGNMELLDAMAAGFSRKTAEAFWLGFPADWKQLVNDHFSTTHLNSIEEEQADSEEEITTLESDGEDSDDPDARHEDITLTELVSADEGDAEPTAVETVDVHHSPEGKKKDETRKGSKSEVIIENWIIKLLPNGKGIHVLGTKSDSGLLWHSSAIEKRIDKKRLMSSSRSTYKLKGNLDRLLALNEGLPVQIINKFSSGFPKEWQELVQEFMCRKNRKNKKGSKTKQKKKSAHSERNQKRQNAQTLNKKVTSTKESQKPKQEVQRTKQLTKQTASTKKKAPKSDSTPVETLKWTKNVLTPNGEMVDLETIGRSRSGRLIKPPLQWWTGQTLELDGDSITVKAPTAAASMFLQNFEDGYKKSKHKVKSYWNPREKDKDYSINTSKSSLNITASSVESGSSVSKQKRDAKASFKIGDVTSQSSEDDLDPKLKVEVKLILEKAKNKRSKVKPRDTCYSRKRQVREVTRECDNPFELDITLEQDTTTETEQELSGQNKMRVKKIQKGSKIKTARENQSKVEQVNLVSSSTCDVDNKNQVVEKEVEGRVACRSLRSRKVKSCENTNINMNLHSGRNQNHKVLETSVRFPRRRKQKILSVIDEDENEDQKESTERTMKAESKSGVSANRKIPVKKRKSVEKNDTNDLPVKSVESIEIDDHWTKEEKDRLKEACKNVSPSNPHYWEKVAAEVRTKSVELCKAMYFTDNKAPKSAEKKIKKSAKEKPKVTSLTANVGTLKRKQQLKDLLEQHNENYEDDLFDSTPYRLTRKRKIPILGEDDDDGIFEELARKQGKTRFETPVATETVCRRVPVPFASTKKTPVSNINVEMLEGSEVTDGYVHKILKRRLLAKGKKKVQTPKVPKKKPQEEISPQQQLLFHKYLKEKKDTTENHHDSDQEEDFYWEDDTEN